jgi:hypothetical protein
VEQETYSVYVIDMYHYDKDEDFTVHGFATLEVAKEYARRRTRSSVEESRCKDPESTSRAWHQWGESCFVVGGDYSANTELDFFIANKATPEECDFASIEPKD